MTGNSGKAIENYQRVLKSHPNYDMEFYAKIKMAKLARGASGDNKQIRNLLARMAKDGKYKDYWDQVYYELALISISENNRIEARNLLHKSIDNSTTNDDQKALSFLKLAELDYEEEEYVSAKFFYDSTLVFMAKNDARYADIDERDKMLDNLVKQLDIIAQEDSLQRLAALPKDERERVVREALERKEQAEEDKKLEQKNAQQQSQMNTFQNTGTGNTQTQSQSAASGSSWYFYNVSARAAGYNDFIKKWGRRKIEENWRRKDKGSSMSTDEETTAAAAAAADTTAALEDIAQQPKTPEEEMMAAIPTSPEKMSKSTDKIV